MNAWIEFELNGEVRLAKRGEQITDVPWANVEGGAWGTVELLDELPVEGINLSLSAEDGYVKLTLQLYHVEGASDGAVYHLGQSVRLRRDDAAVLRDWLTFLLAR